MPQVTPRLKVRNDKNESGCVRLIRPEGEALLPRLPNERPRGGGAGGSQGSQQQGFRGVQPLQAGGRGGMEEAFVDAWLGGKALKRAGLVLQMGHTLSLCT